MIQSKFRTKRTIKQSVIGNDSKEENPDWNGFWGYIPHPEESHHWGECMEDWYD